MDVLIILKELPNLFVQYVDVLNWVYTCSSAARWRAIKVMSSTEFSYTQNNNSVVTSYHSLLCHHRK